MRLGPFEFSWGKKSINNQQRGYGGATNVNRNMALYPTDNKYGMRYATMDDVYSIVRMLSTTSSMIPMYGYLVKSDDAAQKAYKELSRIKSPHFKQRETKLLQVKSLEDLPDTDPVEQLISSITFELKEFIFTTLYTAGEAFIYKVRPPFGVNAGKVIELLPLHPMCVILKVTDTLPRRVVAYDYRVNGQLIYENIPLDDMIHIKYFNPDGGIMIDGSELRGLSPIKVLKKRLERLDSNMDTSVAQLQNGGVETIVFVKDVNVNDPKPAKEILDQMKDSFYKYIKEPSNAGSPYWMAGEPGSIQLGLSLADLSVLELAKVDFKKLCNVWGTSDVLFNNDTASTESNVKEMTKRSYTNTILPNVYRLVDAIRKDILAEFEKGRKYMQVNAAGDLEMITIKGDGKKRDIQLDLSEIPELQENYKDLAIWLAASWWITPNEKRLVMKYDKLDDGKFDEPLIPVGLMTIEEMGAITDIPPVTPGK